MKELRIGIIGFGIRARHVFNYMVTVGKDYGLADVRLAAIADVKSKEELITFAKSDGMDIDVANTVFYNDVDEMLSKEKLDGCLVGTKCNLHTKMAIKVLSKNIPLFLEKPVSVTIDELLALKEAYEKSKSATVVSFPLRFTPQVLEAKKVIDSGEIGEVIFANGWTRVSYGGTYYHEWYRDESITGGLFLQKATHDFDYLNYLIGKKPKKIVAVRSKMMMKGDHKAGLLCNDCPESPVCPESELNMRKLYGYAPKNSMCCFAKDTGNEDSGSAIVVYEDGMHLSYSQAFFLRNDMSCGRGCIIGGTKGSVSFDWLNDTVKVVHSYDSVSKDIKIKATGAHFGGDERLTLNFIKMLLGLEKSHSPLEEGLDSALICIKATQSARDNEFKDIVFKK